MRILVSAPCFYPLGQIGYGGMERLAVLLAREWAKEHDVVVVGARGSVVPGVGMFCGSEEGSFWEAELKAHQEYGWLSKDVDLTIDLSHSHFFSNEPGASWIWHDPKLMNPQVPRTGLYALSQWQAKRHQEVTGQAIPVLDCICADPEVYYYDSKVKVGDRWFSLGIMDKNKGQLEAALIAEEAGIGLDIAGKPVNLDVVEAVKEVEKRTQGRIKYLGELKLGEIGKANLMRQARGMLYWPSYPEGFGEAHSQKLVEALMLGLPCVVRDQGAMREVFGTVAWCAQDEQEAKILFGTNLVSPSWVAERAVERWSTPIVAQRILEVVAGAKV